MTKMTVEQAVEEAKKLLSRYHHMYACHRHDYDPKGEPYPHHFYSQSSGNCYAPISGGGQHGVVVTGACSTPKGKRYYDWVLGDKSPFRSIEPKVEFIDGTDGLGKITPMSAYVIIPRKKQRWCDFKNLLIMMRVPMEFPGQIPLWEEFQDKYEMDPRDAFLLVTCWTSMRGFSDHLSPSSQIIGGHWPIGGQPWSITYERFMESDLNQKHTNQLIFSDSPQKRTDYYWKYPGVEPEVLKKGQFNMDIKGYSKQKVVENYGRYKESISRRG